MGYTDIGDNELIYLIRANNEEAKDYFTKRYQKRIYGMIQSFKNKAYLKKLDYQDYYSQCLIIFFRCLELFDNQYNFYLYFKSAIDKELKRIIDKDEPYKELISLDCEIYNDDSYPLDYVSDASYLYRENAIKEMIETNFSLLEQEIIKLRMEGYNYLEIANKLDIEINGIYKRLTKIKDKLKKKI